jgi:predicted lipid-binding transport protein (Tim44 family)
MSAQPAHDVLAVKFMKIRRLDMKTFWIALVAVFMVSSVGLTDAQAKRVGGGGSVGKQAPSGTMQRNTTPSTPAGQNATPATPAAPAAAQNAAPARPAAPPPAAQPQRNRWLGPIAGLAAGLGLAALASHLGFGGELASMVGSMLMIGLMVMAGLALFAWIRSRRAGASRGLRAEPAYAGGYSPSSLGREATVSPVPVQTQSSFESLQSSQTGSYASQSHRAGGDASDVAMSHIPADFDSDGFLRSAKVCFVRMQASYDAANTADLREFTSPEMFAELKLEIDARKGAANQTDVVTLEAELLGVDTGPIEQMASVRFTGMIREEAGATAQPFDEVWNFTRPIGSQGGWVLAGIQQVSAA